MIKVEYLEDLKRSAEKGELTSSIYWGRLQYDAYDCPRDRDCFRKHYSFAIPSPDAIDNIAAAGRIVEMGAGNGYWAHLIAKAGADIVAYDIREGWDRDFWDKHWYDVEPRSPWELRFYPDRALLVVWPPMSDMASYCLRVWKGKDFFYVGESDGGCNGDEAFFETLEKDFDEIYTMKIPQWSGMNDWFIHYRRKG